MKVRKEHCDKISMSSELSIIFFELCEIDDHPNKLRQSSCDINLSKVINDVIDLETKIEIFVYYKG